MFFRFILTASVCVTLYAQADRGTVTGTVVDPQGGVVPQAKVGLRNAQTGSQYETVTTPTGNYSLGQLPAGTYDLSVEYTGFKKFTQQGIAVQVAQTERVDVVLEVGSTADTVTITADATLLKTETAEQSYNIATERINALPLNFSARGPGSFRDPFAFVQLVPGANITDRNNIRVNGQPNATFAIRLEGQDTSRPLDPLNSDMVAPSVESLQEMSVQTSNFAAEYGQVAGGLFNFTTKSGTNQLHGTVYGYFAAWRDDGTLARLHDALRAQVRAAAGRDAEPTAAVIDSQSVRAADTVPRASRGWDNAKKVNGRKRHIAVDAMGLLLAVVITAASVQDRDAARPLLWNLRRACTRVRLVWADAGYTTRKLAAWAAAMRMTVQIVAKRDRHSFKVLPRRWVVERTFARISKHRRTVRDYEHLTASHEAMILWAMIVLMARRLAQPDHSSNAHLAHRAL